MVRASLLCMLSLLVAACGAGVAAWDYPIVAGYYLSDAGGDNRMIVYKGATIADSAIVIDARVDNYIVSGSRIFVARRPWFFITNENGASSAELSPDCEFWTIDTETKAVAKLASNDQRPDLRCK